MRKVLIADPNTPFATVIGEALRRLGGYTVSLAATADEARQLCAETRPDLAVLDVDLPGDDPAAVVAALRQAVPGLPIILIPYDRDEVPANLSIQGILTKPFFIPDLPALVDSVLGAPAEPPDEPEAMTLPLQSAALPSAPRAPAPPVRLTDENRPLVEGHVRALSHAVREEPALLTLGSRVVTIAPRLSQTASRALAEVVARAWQGRALAPGEEVVRFEGASDSTRYMLYSYAVAEELVLSLALRVRIPLPTLRRLVREAAEQIAAVVAE